MYVKFEMSPIPNLEGSHNLKIQPLHSDNVLFVDILSFIGCDCHAESIYKFEVFIFIASFAPNLRKGFKKFKN